MATRERLRLEAPRPAAPSAPAGAVRPRPAAPSRARPLPLGLPLTGYHLERIGELEQLVGRRYQGWGADLVGWFVDVLEADVDLAQLRPDGSGAGVERFRGDTLHLAIGAALRAARGQP